MTLFVQLLLNGLVAGSLYGMVAVGFALIFGATRHFHIAHAAVFAAGGYLAYGLITKVGLPVSVAVPVGLAGSVLLGMVIARFLYSPLGSRGGAGFVLFLVSLGALIVIENTLTLWLTTAPAKIDLGGWWRKAVHIGSWALTGGQIAFVLLTVLAFVALVLVLDRTRAGKLVKAYSGNPEFVQVVGRRPQSVLLLVYSVGSFFAAIAGLYVAADTGMQPGLGETYFITSIMAVILGGIGSIRGAFVAAMLLGILQNILLYKMPAEWTLPAIFALFLVVITLSPAGLSTLNLRKFKPRNLARQHA